MDREKDLVAKEKVKMESMLVQQNKILDSTKNTFAQELNKQRQQIEALQGDNIELNKNLHEYEVKQGEREFQMKLMEQNHVSGAVYQGFTFTILHNPFRSKQRALVLLTL